jgi:16S rRNA (adenine1518-N6/adenine1519-N6)-dimethyltransferase
LNTVVTAAFSQRRKTLRNSLRKLILEEHITELGIDSKVRAETIPLADFARLGNFIDENPLAVEE